MFQLHLQLFYYQGSNSQTSQNGDKITVHTILSGYTICSTVSLPEGLYNFSLYVCNIH